MSLHMGQSHREQQIPKLCKMPWDHPEHDPEMQLKSCLAPYPAQGGFWRLK